MSLLPIRSCLSNSARNGSAATSADLTSRCSPVAVAVTTMTGRRAARSALSSVSVSSFILCSTHLLDKDPDGAAAGQPDIPGGLVGGSESHHLRLAACDHVQRI